MTTEVRKLLTVNFILLPQIDEPSLCLRDDFVISAFGCYLALSNYRYYFLLMPYLSMEE